MAVTVRWDGDVVGTISLGALTSATAVFERVWRDLEREGETAIAPPFDGQQDDALVAHRVSTVRTVDEFLGRLESLGYTLEGDSRRERNADLIIGAGT